LPVFAKTAAPHRAILTIIYAGINSFSHPVCLFYNIQKICATIIFLKLRNIMPKQHAETDMIIHYAGEAFGGKLRAPRPGSQ